jgi:hypothetical protein
MLNISIVKPKLLLGEGKDEVIFFEGLLKFLGIVDVQVLDYSGRYNIVAGLSAIVKLPGFDSLQSLGITRDADYFDNLGNSLLPKDGTIGEAQAAFDSVCNALRVSAPHLPLPVRLLAKATAASKPTVSIYILPDCSQPGMLEDLCLRSVRETPVNQCIDDYFTCVAQQTGHAHPDHKLSKARIHAWLATQIEPDLRLGEAASKGYWDFTHPTFDNLKQFLQAL